MTNPWAIGDWFVFVNGASSLRRRVTRVSENAEYVEFWNEAASKLCYAKTSDIYRVKKALAEKKNELKKEQGKARTLPELLALAKKKGYKPGWAYKIFHGRKY